MIKKVQRAFRDHLVRKNKKRLRNYYLNKKTEKCLEKNNTNFNNCKITLDGEKCEQCEDDYFLSEDSL